MTLEAVADSYLTRGSRNQNQGDQGTLRLRSSGKNRALVGFDAVQLGAVLDRGDLVAATLELHIANNGDNWGSTGRGVDVHRLTEAWTESGVTWNCGDDSDPYNSSPDCSAVWDGGSYAAEASATVLHENGLSGWVSFDVTSDVALLAAGQDHQGWLLKKTDEGASGLVEYTSRESSCDLAPRLRIEIQPVAADTTAPEVALTTPDQPYVINDDSPELVVSYFDPGSGVDPSSVQLVLDGADITDTCAVCAWRASCESPLLSDGSHSLSVDVVDNQGNLAHEVFEFAVLLGDGINRVTVEPVSDTFLRQGVPNQSQGDLAYLRVRQDGHNRALVSFAQAELENLAAGAPVVAAALELHIEANGNNWGVDGRIIDLLRVGEGWDESAATWNCGSDSDLDNQQADCATEWDGGTYDLTASASERIRKYQTGWIQ
ncbi:MAG: DNRLRE domain-containing protein, partial [bacterium]|nr:DNRLRE domain-containing protein [bacterium]